MHKINKSCQILMILMGILLLWGTASANSIIPNGLTIDFRSADWTAATGLASYTVGNVTASAGGIGAAAIYRTFELYQDNVDGLGVQTYNNAGDQKNEIDEVNIGEVLTITIDSGMFLSGVWVSDLYDWDTDYPDENFKADEYGHLVINDSTTIDFGAFNNGQYIGETNGELWVSFGGLMDVTTISFFAGSSSEYVDAVDSRNEYSVVGFTSTPVPEPATLLLLGSGIMAGAGVFRKKIRFKESADS